ncbi:MAG: hypothetical protein HQM03_19855 [Magnetococcales bacterium]|nr:hypothetical protein [Magnetococcales bacterium]
MNFELPEPFPQWWPPSPETVPPPQQETAAPSKPVTKEEVARHSKTDAANRARKEASLAKQQAVQAAVDRLNELLPQWETGEVPFQKASVAEAIKYSYNSIDLSSNDAIQLGKMSANTIASSLAGKLPFLSGKRHDPRQEVNEIVTMIKKALQSNK